MSGQTEEARRRLAELRQTPPGPYVEPYAIALIHTALREQEEALSSLEQAYLDHSVWLGMWAKADPRLDPLRSDVRFQDLLRRLGVGAS